MGLNDSHFTNPEITPGWTPEQHQNEVRFRQQLASVFRPLGSHNVQMETGHTLLPVTHPDAIGPPGVGGGEETHGPQVIVQHRNAHYGFSLPLGSDPRKWMGDLAAHLNSRPVMEQMRDQMNGPYGDE
jgi:hypothetical protein